MGKIILVTGGTRSGKSTFGEDYFKEINDVMYIATASNIDGEMDDRIRRHKENRNQKWITHEGYKDLNKIVRNSNRHVLLDCVTNMINNLIFDNTVNMDEPTLEEKDLVFQVIKDEFKNLLLALKDGDKEAVFITNEVGMGLISEYKLGRLFTDYTGFINQYLAKESDEVYFMVSGLPLRMK